jgi:DNA-binding transcriptional regulator GbsR (MarR family)
MIDEEQTARDVRMRLVDVGGRTSQDLGLGRIVGQILVYLYLSESVKSLDEIGEDLELSKAAVSIAARQLERLGLLVRAWKKGDRKAYYRTADNIATALRQGMLVFFSQKIEGLSTELNHALAELKDVDQESKAKSSERDFLLSRVSRAHQLGGRASKLINNPIIQRFV